MKKLMWGKALIAIAKKNASGYGDFKLFPEMVENSTNLATTKGEKKEAKVEGGGVEAVRYGLNAYALTADYRRGTVNGKMVEFPFEELDGTVEGTYALRVQPEDKTVGGITVMEVLISTEDTFTASDGAIKKVTFDFIKPDQKEDGTCDPTINWDPIPNILAAFDTSAG